MPELHELTAAQLARQIRAREISAVDVAEALLARTDALESLQAWVYIDRETVLADAEQRQRELDTMPNPRPACTAFLWASRTSSTPQESPPRPAPGYTPTSCLKRMLPSSPASSRPGR